jgi:bacterioferritin
MEQHAQDELNHALLLSSRIVQLGGTPPLAPSNWLEETNCGYEAPENPVVYELIDQNIRAEQCAIDIYNTLAGLTKDTDPTTYQVVLQILQDEIEHEEDLEALKEDLAIAQVGD